MERTAAERRERRIRPLTQEDAEFAAEHIHLVYWYLGRRGLPADEWLDAVILRYLDTVKRWHTEPELREYSFTTIVSAAMRSALWAERKKRARRPRTVSLYAPIPGTDGLTYEQILANSQGEPLPRRCLYRKESSA